jgi:DNA-binding NtrC family response regulator
VAKQSKILVVDDDTALREMMKLSLSKEGFKVTAAASSAAALEAINDGAFDLVVTDIYLGDGTGLELLEHCQTHFPEAKVILVTAHGTIETAASARRLGVFDYLAKPFAVESLVERVRAALQSPGPATDRLDLGPQSMIIGNDPAIVEVYNTVARVAPLPISVLIRGETGTGKELIARALHRFGANPDGPFVPINCGAIPENLLESELFGHRKGSFTGADRDHRGAIESARDGTLFLDEIGELPASLQVKLLRFLQSGEVRPVGSDATLHVPVRVVAATNRDLRAEVKVGVFREDFYFRLAAYEIVLPPLRDRRSDIPALVEHFRRRHAENLGVDTETSASKKVLDVLMKHSWPGNVRELEHAVQRALVDHGALADADRLARLLSRDTGASTSPAAEPAIGDDFTLKELETRHIEAVLRRCGGNRTRAAEILGIERKSLYRKAERLGVALDHEEDTP